MRIKRNPGRPKGSGIDDSDLLGAIADFILRNPDVSKTAAIGKIVCGNFEKHNHEAGKRRLQRKWLSNSADLLQAASDRRSEPPKVSRTITNGLSGATYFSELFQLLGRANPLQNAALQIQDMLDPPALRAMRDAIELSKRI